MDPKQNFLESLPNHIGYGNLLSQLDKDQGDTCQRMGTLYALLMIVGDQDLANKTVPMLSISSTQAFDELEEKWGIYRRSPNPDFWGYESNCLSRDQLSILKIGMAALGEKKRLIQVLIRQILRFGFHQNTHAGGTPDRLKIPDIIIPSELGVYFRGLLGPLSIIPNHIVDLFFFIDLLLRKVGLSSMWDCDNMLSANLLFANWQYPTLWSRLAMSFYKKTDFMDRLWNYHKDEDGNNGCEPLFWLFKMAFNK